MPLPVMAWKCSVVGSSRPRSRARATIASPSRCSEPTSAAAARRSGSCSGLTPGQKVSWPQDLRYKMEKTDDDERFERHDGSDDGVLAAHRAAVTRGSGA